MVVHACFAPFLCKLNLFYFKLDCKLLNVDMYVFIFEAKSIRLKSLIFPGKYKK